MISAYVGLPGSGKTYQVMEHVILPALRAGRRVTTNVAVNHEECMVQAGVGASLRMCEIEDFRAESLARLIEPGAVVVVDEAQMVWPAGLKVSELSELHRSFFSEHRHRVGADGHAMEIVLVTQDLANVCTFVRGLVGTTYRSVSGARFGARTRFRVDVFEGGRANNKLTKRIRQREMYARLDPAVFKTYRSHTKSVSGPGRESETDQRSSIWRSARVRVVLPIAAVALVASVASAVSFFSPERKPARAVASEAARPSPPPPRPALFAPVGGLPVSARIVGVVVGQRDRGGAAVVFSAGRSYFVDLGQCWQEYADDWRCTWRGQVVSQ